MPFSTPTRTSMPAGNATLTRHFKRSRLVLWSGFALALLLAPQVFGSGLALTVLCQIGYMIIICLSYNLLLGQGGMLSFGHAVYTGLGAFAAIHALNMIGAGSLALPVSLVPLVGGLGGGAVAALLGWVTTKKSANTFAMITLGVGELVFAMSLMFPEVFGGEGGISANRVAGPARWGITFGPQIQVYYLIAVYCFICTGALFALTRTPFGRILNAVRDNPERVEFIGYNTQMVRYIAFVIAGFFAGVGGGLTALNFEIVTAESVGALRSGSYLLFTFLGGSLFFFGPIIGAVLAVLAMVLLSEVTKAWSLYMGLVFMLMVMYAPGGIASLVMMNWRLAAAGKLRRLLGGYLGLVASSLWLAAGVAALVEMVYHLQLDVAAGPQLGFLGLTLDVQSAVSWAGAVIGLLLGAALFQVARRRFQRQWSQVQHEIALEALRPAPMQTHPAHGSERGGLA